MGWRLLQLTEVALCAAVALPAHLVMVRVRRPFLRDLEGIGGRAVGLVASVADVVAALVYTGYVLTVLPFEGPWGVTARDFESALDSVGLFALFVAAVEVVSLVTIHRVAFNLEQWPPKRALDPAV